MGIEPVINGGLSFAAVLILMALNIPIGIAMLLVGFIGFALISGFDPAIFVLGTAPFDAVSKYTLSVLPLFVLMLTIMSLMAYATTVTSYKFMNNQRVTLDLELYFYPFYFICAIGMWLSVIAIIVWFIKTISNNSSKSKKF